MKLTNLLLAGFLMCPVAFLAQEPAAPDAKTTSPGLAPGDQIAVRLYDLPDVGTAPLNRIVNADGTIHLPYAGAIPVLGLAPNEAERAIVEALRTKGIVKEPNVSVEIVSAMNLTVSVTGQVMSPQTVPLYAPTPISFIMTKVGGLNGLAAKHLTIIHRSGEEPTSIDYDAEVPNTATLNNTLVYPGDIVHVSSAGVYFVVGEVARPGIYPLTGALNVGQITSAFGMGITPHITFLQALSQVGGITSIAARSHCRILRTAGGKREEIELDIVKIEKGEMADPLLHPDDIIYVPSSYIRSVTNNIFPTVLSALYAATTVKQF